MRVEIRHLGMTYESANIHAIADVSFTVEEATFCSLLGPSGCGKSTILLLVAGLLRPSKGVVLLENQPVLGPPPDLGIVFQKDVLLPWLTVLDNVLTPFRMAERRHRVSWEGVREQALVLLKQAGLQGFEQRYPSQLSGGMRQRVAICRALVTNPSLLLMDEPFGALDALTREQMAFDLLRLWTDSPKTVLFVTHSVDEAVLLSDKVIILSQRPSRVFRFLDIELPRPRRSEVRASKQYRDYVEEARSCFYDMGYFTHMEGSS